jgi:aerobic carbon-monoxide dehydrogenase large subunit
MGGLIGARIPRLEDGALLVGKGRFVDDIAVAGMWHAAFVRSPHPHAAIRRINVQDAIALPGVHAVLTLDDLAPVLAKRRMLRRSNSGTPLDRYWSFALADGEVSYVGEAVAIVLADSRYVAEDAAAVVVVDYDVLASVSDARSAIEPTAPAVRRCRSSVRQGRARFSRGALAASWRCASDRGPRHFGGMARRHHDGVGLDAESA